jgi:hypothetical protein
MMLKRAAFIFMAFILCGAYCSAQDKIDAETYVKLVDYVNCKYMVAYVNANLLQDNTQNGLKGKLEELDKCSLNNLEDIPDFETIKQALRQDEGDIQPQTRTKKINALKEKNIAGLNNQEIVNIILNEFNSIDSISQRTLFDCKEQLGKNLNKKYKDTNPSLSTDTLSKVTIDDKDKKSETFKVGGWSSFRKFMLGLSIIGLVACVLVRLKFWNKLENRRERIIFYCIAAAFVAMLWAVFSETIRNMVFIAAGIFIIGVVVNYFFKKQKKDRMEMEKQDTFTEGQETIKRKPEEPKKIIMNDELYQRVFNWILENNKNFMAFSNYILQNEQRCSLWVKNSLKHPEIRKMLEKEFLRIENPIHHSGENQKHQEEKKIVAQSWNEVEKQADNDVRNATTLYADSIFDDFFNKTSEMPNEDTVFELHLPNAQNATFTIYLPAKRRIIANPAFLEGCEKQVLINGQDVKVIDEGTAQQQANGKWKIIKKLNVIIT